MSEMVQMVMMPQSEIDALKKGQEEIKALVLNFNLQALRNQWVESEVARKQVGVCSRTWQAMRDKRVIPFSQYGRKIYFRQGDIDDFMESNLISAK